MGDRRYVRALEHLLAHGAAAVGELTDEEVIQALAALAARDTTDAPYLANVLATEAMNRITQARAAIRHVADAILTVDTEGICIAANPAATELLGWSEGELRGFDVRALLRPDGPGHPPFELPAAIAEDRPAQRPHEMLMRKDGSLMRVASTTAPVRRDGEITGAVIAFHATGTVSEISLA